MCVYVCVRGVELGAQSVYVLVKKCMECVSQFFNARRVYREGKGISQFLNARRVYREGRV